MYVMTKIAREISRKAAKLAVEKFSSEVPLDGPSREQGSVFRYNLGDNAASAKQNETKYRRKTAFFWLFRVANLLKGYFMATNLTNEKRRTCRWAESKAHNPIPVRKEQNILSLFTGSRDMKSLSLQVFSATDTQYKPTNVLLMPQVYERK